MEQMYLRVLIVGEGGRETTLTDTLAKSDRVSAIETMPVASVKEILRFAAVWEPDLVVVGPEKPLVDGVTDAFAKANPRVRVFGPTAAAAKLEGSKMYCKRLCQRYGIPTAAFSVAHNYEEAEEQLRRRKAPVVVKADELRSGKGVRVCATVPEALLFSRQQFSLPWPCALLLEEKLVGKEISVMAVCDGQKAILLPIARDYKRLNATSEEMTGGMGAYSPLPEIQQSLLQRIKREIIDKLLEACRAEGHPYRGVLYAGIMLTRKGPYLLEVNCRFGDPEAQVVLPRIKNDLLPYLLAATYTGGLSDLPQLRFGKRAAVCVCVASKGYPARGKRLYSITGIGTTVAEARERAYRKVRALPDIEKLYFRDDIAAGV